MAGLAERLDSTAARWESSFGGAGYPHLIALLREAAADKRASLAQVDALRVALEPFAAMVEDAGNGKVRVSMRKDAMTANVVDVIRARTVLAKATPPVPGGA